MEGTVKWYNEDKGFGFIVGEDEKEYFVHKSELTENTRIKEGDKVVFEASENERGPCAKKVNLA